MEELGNPVEIEFVVRFSECDPYGIAHNSNYFSWFEMGRFKYAQENGYAVSPSGKDSDVIYATLKTKCRFIKSCRFNDEIVIKTRMKKRPIIYAIYSFEQVMCRKSTGEVLAKCVTENVAIDKKTQKVVLLKDDKALIKIRDAENHD